MIKHFVDFAQARHIDRPTVIRILEDVFRAMIRRKFEVDDNFDIIINLDEGDLQIWRFREVVEDSSSNSAAHDKISLSEARALEADFEVGEEVSEEIPFSSFGRRAITTAKRTLFQKVKDLASEALYTKYTQLVGELISAEVYQIFRREVIVLDDEKNELSLPYGEQIAKDRFRKGAYLRAVVHQVSLQHNNVPKVVLSRTSPVFLTRLFEAEIPEVAEGLITVKKVVRDPGGRAKVAVESYDDRVDPVGACVGMRGARIHSIVGELQGENVDVINYTDNLDLYISRALSPAKISNVQHKEDRVAVYLNPDQVSLAIGRGGQNIKLASRLIGKEIDVYRELDTQEEDVRIEEFSDEIDEWIIKELKKVGFDSAKSILSLSKEDLARRADLERETVDHLYDVLRKEFEETP